MTDFSNISFRLALHALGEAALLVDEKGLVRQANPAFEALSGFAEQELIGTPLERLDAVEGCDHEIETASGAPMNEGLGACRRYRRRDGGVFLGQAIAIPLLNEAGVRLGHCRIILGVLDRVRLDDGLMPPAVPSDVIESRRVERVLREKTQALERSNADQLRFAQIASHDLREPLRRVITYTQILMEDFGPELSPEAAEIAAVIQSGGRRLRLMLDDLLTYMRLNERLDSRGELVDMSAVLGHALDDLKHDIERDRVSVEVVALPLVWGSPVLLKMALHHLIANAAKYSGDRSPVIDITVEDGGDIWRFAIADRGIGVEPRFADRIFEIFQRLESRDEGDGSGSGLAICRLIIQRLGGEIWLDRTYDKGARFVFTLPKAGTRPASPTTATATPETC